jgi:hypothetical protein
MAYGRKEQETSTPEENLVVKDINLEETVGKVFTFNGVNHTILLAIADKEEDIDSQDDGQGSETGSSSKEDRVTSSTVGLVTLSSKISREVTP